MMMQLVPRLIGPALMAVVLLTACARHPSGDRTLEHLRLQTEERLLQDARAAFFQGKYQESELLLERFLTNHPRSRLLDEARWWLARSLQQHGDLHAALVRYRQLAQSRLKNPYRDEAQLRVAELESFLGVNHDTEAFVGVVVGAPALVQPNGLNMAENYRIQFSGSAVMIDVPCRKPSAGETSENASPQDAPMWKRILNDGIRPLVAMGKEQGFGVVVGVSLRCLGSYYDATADQNRRWRDQAYDVRSGRIEWSEAFSLFSAEYRDVVFSLLSQIAELRVEGLIFRATAAPGPYEGLTSLAVRAFEQQFSESLVPEALFPAVPPGNAILSSQISPRRASVSVDYPPMFWKWAGWKAREGFRFMNEVAVNLRGQFPFLKIGLEIHAESIENPLSALVNVGEDWIEMSHGEFDMMVTDSQDLPNARLQPGLNDFNEPDAAERTSALVTRMVEYLGNANRVWVLLPGRESASRLNGIGRSETGLPKGVGLLYDFTAVP